MYINRPRIPLWPETDAVKLEHLSDGLPKLTNRGAARLSEDLWDQNSSLSLIGAAREHKLHSPRHSTHSTWHDTRTKLILAPSTLSNWRPEKRDRIGSVTSESRCRGDAICDAYDRTRALSSSGERPWA
jgi:hypothetical protein